MIFFNRSNHEMTRALIVTIGIWFVCNGALAAQNQQQLDRGMKVFQDQRCSICHSIGGEGNSRGVLDGVGAKLSTEEIQQWITDPTTMAEKTKAERRPAMRAFPDLPGEDLTALVAYLSSLKS